MLWLHPRRLRVESVVRSLVWLCQVRLGLSSIVPDATPLTHVVLNGEAAARLQVSRPTETLAALHTL